MIIFKPEFVATIFDEIRKQGFSILLMSVGLCFLQVQHTTRETKFEEKIKALELKLDNCTNNRIDFLIEERKELITSVNDNTKVLKEVLAELRNK